MSSPAENKAYVLDAIEQRVNGHLGHNHEVAVDRVVVRVDPEDGSGENPSFGPVAAAGGWRLEVHRCFAEADLVVTHSTVTALAGPHAVRFDVWHLAGDGTIVEHQYSQEPWHDQTASGRSQVDGPTQPDPTADTDKARATIAATVQTILVDNDFSDLHRYLAGSDYGQHNYRFDDGVSGLVEALGQLAQQGITMKYDRVRLTVAEGDFVYVLSEGHFGGSPYTFHDLFRVADGRAAEHWDVMVPA